MKIYEIQMSASISKVLWNTVKFIHAPTSIATFMPRAELRNCDRIYGSQNLMNLLSGSPQKKCADLCPRE